MPSPGISIILRDDQQPNAPNAIQFADPKAKFVAVNATNPPFTTTPASTTSSTYSSTPTISGPILASNGSSVLPANSSISAPTPAASSSLSGGAKAAVALGVVVGVLGVGALLYFLSARRQHPRARNAAEPMVPPPGNTDRSCTHCNQEKPELLGQPSRMEMDAAGLQPRWEMDSSHAVPP